MFELTASVLGGEPPGYDGGGLVALALERRDLPSQQRFIADPAVLRNVSDGFDPLRYLGKAIGT